MKVKGIFPVDRDKHLIPGENDSLYKARKGQSFAGLKPWKMLLYAESRIIEAQLYPTAMLSVNSEEKKFC